MLKNIQWINVYENRKFYHKVRNELRVIIQITIDFFFFFIILMRLNRRNNK